MERDQLTIQFAETCRQDGRGKWSRFLDARHARTGIERKEVLPVPLADAAAATAAFVAADAAAATAAFAADAASATAAFAAAAAAVAHPVESLACASMRFRICIPAHFHQSAKCYRKSHKHTAWSGYQAIPPTAARVVSIVRMLWCGHHRCRACGYRLLL